MTGTSDRSSPSLRVIADHIRACSFLIVDGVLPSNEGRGYVLRRIIRRAVRHGYKLGQAQPFFYRLVPPLVAVMGEAIRSWRAPPARCSGCCSRRRSALPRRCRPAWRSSMRACASRAATRCPGALVFLLHDTYGFPPDLTADIARERGLSVDMAGYEREMQAQRERARAASHFGVDQRAGAQLAERSEFCGYEAVEARGAWWRCCATAQRRGA